MGQEDQSRRWVCGVVAHAEVLTVKTEEEIGEHEDPKKGDAEENEDEEKVWFLRGDLLNFHADWMHRCEWTLAQDESV